MRAGNLQEVEQAQPGGGQVRPPPNYTRLGAELGGYHSWFSYPKADPRELPSDLVETIQRFRFQGITSKVNFALDAAPYYPALGDRTDQYGGFINLAPTVEYMERAYDAAKYGWYSEHPYIDASIQSFIDPDMAPPGQHVLSCYVMYTPYQLKDSTWDAQRENMADRVQATMQRFFPNFNDLVLQREGAAPDGAPRQIVCKCADVSDVQIRQAVDGGAGLPELQGALKCGTFCGATTVPRPC